MRVIAGAGGGLQLDVPKSGVRPTMDRVKAAIWPGSWSLPVFSSLKNGRRKKFRQRGYGMSLGPANMARPKSCFCNEWAQPARHRSPDGQVLLQSPLSDRSAFFSSRPDHE